MLELPRWDRTPDDVERNLARIDTWSRTLLDSGLVRAFGGEERTLRSTDSGLRLAALERFASAHWDFRSGRERNLAATAEFSPGQTQLILRTGVELGLAGTSAPSKSFYDAVIMTGGMVRAGIVKPRFLRELESAGLDWSRAVFLGATRQFLGDEVGLAARLGVPGSNEIDAMRSGMARAFDLGDVGGTDAGGSGFGSWLWLDWPKGKRRFQVVAAPSSQPQLRRANTEDTFRYWADRATGVNSLLVITTPVYVPYQGAVSVEVFGADHGMSVETVAVSASANDLGADTQLFGPQQILQELRAAVHGMRRLFDRLSLSRESA